jgi:hypothetical protein
VVAGAAIGMVLLASKNGTTCRMFSTIGVRTMIAAAARRDVVVERDLVQRVAGSSGPD